MHRTDACNEKSTRHPKKIPAAFSGCTDATPMQGCRMTNQMARRRHKPAEKRGRPRLSAAEREGTESSSLRLSTALWAKLRSSRDGRTLRAHAERVLLAGLEALAVKS
jgi:hypothetical protein